MATQSPLTPKLDTAHAGGSLTFTNSDLTAEDTGASFQTAVANLRLNEASGGKYYFEFVIDTIVATTGIFSVGINTANYSTTGEVGGSTLCYGIRGLTGSAIQKKNSAGGAASYGNAPTIVAGDIIGCALDTTANAIWFSVNDSWIDGDGSDSSATVKTEIEAGTTTSASATGIGPNTYSGFTPALSCNDSKISYVQDSLTYTAPSGFSQIQTDGATWNIENSGYANNRYLDGYTQRASTSVHSSINHWGASTGKYHWEVTINNVSTGPYIGIFVGNPTTYNEGVTVATMTGAYVVKCSSGATTEIYANGSSVQSGLAAVAASSVITVEYNATDDEIAFYDDGVQIGTTVTSVTSGTGYPIIMAGTTGGSTGETLNSGRTAFAMTPTSGFEGPDVIPPVEGDGAVDLDMIITATGSGVHHADGAPFLDFGITGTVRIPPSADGNVDMNLGVTATGSGVTHANAHSVTAIMSIDGHVTIPARGDAIAPMSLGVTATTLPLPIHINDGPDMSMTVASEATVIETWHAEMELPLYTLDCVVINQKPLEADLTLPKLTIQSVALAGTVSTVNITLPSMTVLSYGAAFVDVPLPSLTIDATLLPGTVATADLYLPSLTFEGLYTHATDYLGDMTLPIMTCTSTLVTGTVSTAAIELPIFCVEADGLSGEIATATIELPSYTIEAALNGEGRIGVDIELPGMTVVGYMDNANTYTVTGWSMNTENIGTAEYTGFDYLELGSFNGSFYGAKADGIYQLNSADDNGTDIAAEFETGLEDFGTEHYKNIPHVYVGHESDGEMELTSTVDGEAKVRTYSLDRTLSTSGITHSRVRLAKGVKSRYWKFGMKNVAGADFTVDTLGVLPKILQRKT